MALFACLGVDLLRTRRRARLVFARVLPIGALAVVASAVVDRVYYGFWTIAPLNFVRFNVVHGGGALYGTARIRIRHCAPVTTPS